MGLHIVSRTGLMVLALAALGSAPSGRASNEALLAPGLYRAVSSEVVESGRACGYGAPLPTAFLLRVGPSATVAAPSAHAILRDPSGVAMPATVAETPGSLDLLDSTELPPNNRIGRLVVIQREPALWIAVEYRYLDADCRVSGTIVLTPTSDVAHATEIEALVRAFDATAERDRLRAAGKFSEALAPGEVALAAFGSTLGSDHWLSLNAGTNLASLQWDLDAFAAARNRYEHLIPRIAASVGPDHFYVWRARQNLALVLWDQGDFDGAEAILRAVTDRYRTLLSEEDVGALGTRVNLATLVSLRGRIVEAERIMFDVLQRFERVQGPDHPRTLVTMNNLAFLLDSAGRRDDALIHLTTAVERYVRTLGPAHPATLRAEHNRYAIMASVGRRDAAMEGLERVFRARRDALGSNHTETLQSQSMLASMLVEEQRYVEALELQRGAVAGRLAAHGPQHAETIAATARLGHVEVLAGDVQAGLSRMRAARIAAAAALGSHDPATLRVVMMLGLDERASGDPRAARATLAELVQGVERWREAAVLTSGARRDLFAPWVPAYKALAAVESALGNAEAAFEQVERSKARVLVETLALRRSEVRGILPADALDALAALERQLSGLEAEIARAPRDASTRLPLEQRRTALGDEAAALRASLRDRYPKYAALSTPRLVGVRDGAREIPAHGVFASYLRDGDRVLVFTLDRRGRVVGTDLGAFPALDDAILAFRTLLTATAGSDATPVWQLADGRYRTSIVPPAGSVRVTDANVIGAELARCLVLPVPELMRARHWIVSPDGALALLPFEALPLRGRLLVESRDIVYTPSLTVHALTAQRGRVYERSSDRAPLYAMGAAIYDSLPSSTQAPERRAAGVMQTGVDAALSSDPQGVRRAYDVIGVRWPNLPASAGEIRDVASKFERSGRVTVRSAHAATESQLREDDRNGLLSRTVSSFCPRTATCRPKRPACPQSCSGRKTRRPKPTAT